MKRFSGRLVSAALALALASSPAFAGRYHHHDHYRGGSASGWWIGGAVALAAAGLYLAANSEPSYAQAGVTRPAWPTPVLRSMPRRSIRRLSAAPAPVYAAAPQQYAPVQYQQQSPADKALANASTDCQRWAVNQSGYDPATISQWTTQVMVDSYNRALDSCMNSRGYRANCGRNAGGAQRRHASQAQAPIPTAASGSPMSGSPASSSASRQACASSHCCSLNTCKPASRSSVAVTPWPGWRCPWKRPSYT